MSFSTGAPPLLPLLPSSPPPRLWWGRPQWRVRRRDGSLFVSQRSLVEWLKSIKQQATHFTAKRGKERGMKGGEVNTSKASAWKEGSVDLLTLSNALVLRFVYVLYSPFSYV